MTFTTSKKASIIDPQDDLLNFDSTITSTPLSCRQTSNKGSFIPNRLPYARTLITLALAYGPTVPSQSQHLMPNATQDEEDFVAQMIGIPPSPIPAPRQDTSPAPTSRAYTTLDASDDDAEAERSTERRRLVRFSSSVKREQESLSAPVSRIPKKLYHVKPGLRRKVDRRRRWGRKGNILKGHENVSSGQDEAVMNMMIECDKVQTVNTSSISAVSAIVWTIRSSMTKNGRFFRGTGRGESCARCRPSQFMDGLVALGMVVNQALSRKPPGKRMEATLPPAGRCADDLGAGVIDMAIAEKVFVGNEFTTMTANIVMLWFAKGSKMTSNYFL
ncbi:hypothetical protein WG66_001715 [Moniliophthora roreri]|nr:hypothetical protein WG66_001715 [Moniliophthora roreri]